MPRMPATWRVETELNLLRRKETEKKKRRSMLDEITETTRRDESQHDGRRPIPPIRVLIVDAPPRQRSQHHHQLSSTSCPFHSKMAVVRSHEMQQKKDHPKWRCGTNGSSWSLYIVETKSTVTRTRTWNRLQHIIKCHSNSKCHQWLVRDATDCFVMKCIHFRNHMV